MKVRQTTITSDSKTQIVWTQLWTQHEITMRVPWRTAWRCWTSNWTSCTTDLIQSILGKTTLTSQTINKYSLFWKRHIRWIGCKSGTRTQIDWVRNRWKLTQSQDGIYNNDSNQAKLTTKQRTATEHCKNTGHFLGKCRKHIRREQERHLEKQIFEKPTAKKYPACPTCPHLQRSNDTVDMHWKDPNGAKFS